MCDISTTVAVERVIEERVVHGQPFTAWEITRAVSTQTGYAVPHREVRRLVRATFAAGYMSGYVSTLARLPGVLHQPVVYHPVWADLTVYMTERRGIGRRLLALVGLNHG